MGAKDRGSVKGKRGKVMLAVAAAAVLLAVVAAASLWGGRDNDPGQPLSAPAAEILGGERYYLCLLYTTQTPRHHSTARMPASA